MKYSVSCFERSLLPLSGSRNVDGSNSDQLLKIVRNSTQEVYPVDCEWVFAHLRSTLRNHFFNGPCVSDPDFCSPYKSCPTKRDSDELKVRRASQIIAGLRFDSSVT